MLLGNELMENMREIDRVDNKRRVEEIESWVGNDMEREREK